MHRLTRKVRFSVSPFLPQDEIGFNSYCSKPAADGLSLFFELLVELKGTVNPSTGFVINVVEIDKAARKLVVPLFANRIRESFNKKEHLTFFDLADLLKKSWAILQRHFTELKLSCLSLALNPFRKLSIITGEAEMICLSEKFEFAAMHQLWNDEFSDDRNFEVFGKCANPSGHGHNYIMEVTVTAEKGGQTFEIGRFEKMVKQEFLDLVDHKNLNADVDYFRTNIPTVENIVQFAWQRLNGKLGKMKLADITVWETDKIYCSYRESM